MSIRAIAAALIVAPSIAGAQIPAEVRTPGLYFRSAPEVIQQATRLSTDIDVDVTGIVARVSIAQKFRNQSGDWIEGIYVFPLPDDAAVDRLTMQIGDRRIEGEIQEREQAKRTYVQAREAGQQASLVEQERPNLFTTSVANIAPGQEVTIEIGYQQTADYDAGQFSLRLPLTLTPRFIPGTPLRNSTGSGFSHDTTDVPDASRITPPVLSPNGAITNTASIDVGIEAGARLAEVGSSSHAMASEYDGTRYRLTSAGDVPMDRDIVVDWRIVPDQAPRAVAFTETVGAESFVLLMFLPPTTADLPDPTAREMSFVIDTSGSMGGTSIVQAKSALRSGLNRLTTVDRFNVIEFNSDARSLFGAPVSTTPENLAEARRFVDSLSATGGTNIASAIAAALGQRPTPNFLRQIIFVTDGSVGNEAGVFEMIRNDLGDARLFTVGIGSAPNTHFMRKAAQFGRGSYTHISRTDDVEPEMSRLFDKLGHVALTDIRISWPGAIDVYPERIPDLYRGEPVVVAARFGGALNRPIALEASGDVGPYEWSQRIDVRAGSSPGVRAIWARRKIETLLDRRLEGRSEDEIRGSVLAVALTHGLLSPYTSLVAVDRTPERSRNAQLRRESLGSMLPAGADFESIFGMLPTTATDARIYQLIGTVLASLILGLIGIWRLTRKLK